MTKMNTNPDITATARDAGRNVVHTVKVHGTVVGTRRSAHRYAYAICEWVTWGRNADGSRDRRVIVKRWSGSPKASGADFAVPVTDAVKCPDCRRTYPANTPVCTEPTCRRDMTIPDK